MDTTTQYKLNKYSKKVNDAYKQHNMSKVNEYMQHQFNYINKYAQQQHGGGLEEIKALLASIVKSVRELNEEIRKNNGNIRVIGELKQKIAQLEEKNSRLGGTDV
jgi:gas vesicle protein